VSTPPVPKTAAQELPLAATLLLGSILWLTLAGAALLLGAAWLVTGVDGLAQRAVLFAILLGLGAGAWGLGGLFGGMFWPAMRKLLPAAQRISPLDTARNGGRDRLRLLLLGFLALAILLIDALIWGLAGALPAGLVMAAYFLAVWGAFMRRLARDLREYEEAHARVYYSLPERTPLDYIAPRFAYVALIRDPDV